MNSEVKVLASIGIVTLILIVGGVFFLNKSNKPKIVDTAKPADQTTLVKENSHKIATESAKVTVVEFGDYQCPACRLAEPTIKQILQEGSAKINFVFRNFPLSIHQNAKIAAQAAEAASDQGKFWEMHDILYENQSNWSENSNPEDLFANYAKDLKLDVDKFKKDVADKKYTGIINKDLSDGESLGVNSTPTFFINGQKLTGAPSVSNFKAAINQAASAK